MELFSKSAKDGADVVLDRKVALSQLDGDADTLAMLLDLFRADAPNTLEAIRKAVKESSASGLRSAAHKFKGSLSALGAGLAMKAALQLETIGRAGDMTGAQSALTVLEHEIGRLGPELDDFSKELRSSSH